MISEKFLKEYQKEYARESAARSYYVYRDTAHYFAICSWLYKENVKESLTTRLRSGSKRTFAGRGSGGDGDHGSAHNGKKAAEIANWLAHIRSCNPFLLGVRTAFEQGDMEILSNALYQLAAIEHATSGINGYDHSGNMNRCVPSALAAGLTERIPLLLPQELGLCGNGFPPHVAMANLIMALWYKREDFESPSRKTAEKALSKKTPLIYSTAIRYLLALLDGDTNEAGTRLEQHCRAVPGIRDASTARRIDKLFWYDAHALYNLAFFVLGTEKALEIPVPEHDCFCSDLAEWQANRNFAPGKLFIEHPAPMELLNAILTSTPPATELIEMQNTGRKKKYTVDIESFKSKLIAAVISSTLQP